MNQQAEALTRKHTAFLSFTELLWAKGGYRPSIGCLSTKGARGAELKALADAYDAAQEARGDARRASRY